MFCTCSHRIKGKTSRYVAIVARYWSYNRKTSRYFPGTGPVKGNVREINGRKWS
jgi:hypothetical protein